MCVFTAAMLVISRKLPISALTDRGVQGRVSFAPWHEVLTYRFSDPNGLSLTVVGHVTFMPEIALELDCPPELREEALAVFREHAPTAKLLGRVPGTET